MTKNDESMKVPIVAIGASAGGVQALQALFRAVSPNTGAAFVVVLHLSPEHSSQLAAIIGAQTAMPVHEVSDAMPIKANTVYVIPPNRELVVAAEKIDSQPITELRGSRAPIDHFFRSMAIEHGDGFAIILTGGGTDGAVGVKAVKEGGGLILVQDPAEAEYASMPNSAIASGVADFVLPLAQIAEKLPELVKLKKQLRINHLEASEEDLLRRILGFLKARTGNDFTQYKRATIGRRLARRMQVVHAQTLRDYLQFIQTNPDEVRSLLSDLLISVTSFFRDGDAFEKLAKDVLPALLKARAESAESLRVWVPACATGEEVYSLAMMMVEESVLHELRPEIQIFASDLDPGALATAREGRYPLAIQSDVTEERLRRFFARDGDHYRIKREIRDLVVFAQHSVLRDPPFSHIDLVSCRNLLIYLDRNLQSQICATFHYALRPGGYLFLGSSESIDGQSIFRTVDRDSRIFQAIDRTRVLPSLPNFFSGSRISDPPAAISVPREPRTNYASDHKHALELFSPPSMIVDETHRMLNLSESAGRYILAPGGPPSTFATDVVRPELRLDLQASLHRAFEQNEATLTLPVAVKFNGHARQVSLHVRPISRESATKTALVLFLEGASAEVPPDHVSDDDNSSFLVTQLRNELSTTQSHLRTSRAQYEAVTEELRASNEELQSINEEYRSTSEELETSKEELQSINEELQTLNNELKLKLDVVSRAHNDLQNLMSATDVATLFLTTGLRINRFTPRVADIFNIVPGDEGRPISDFTHRLDYPHVIADASKVVSDLTPIERIVSSTDGHWYMMRIRLYRTLEDKIDGTVVTFVDITEQRLAEQQWERRQELLLAELSHRVKNTLAVVQAIVSQTLNSDRVPGVTKHKVTERLAAIAKAHGLLLNANWKGAILEDIVRGQLEALIAMNPTRVAIAGPSIFLPSEVGTSIGLVIHELGTNAIKYGALSNGTGSVTIEWTVIEDEKGKKLHVTWKETDGPAITKAPVLGFGSRLIATCIPNARVDRDFNKKGLTCEIVVPLIDGSLADRHA